MSKMDVWTMVPPVVAASAAAAAAVPVFGFDSPPQVLNQGGYAEIVLSPAQEDQVAAFMLRQLNSEPGAVRVNLGGVMAKVLARKYGIYLGAGVVASALLGSLFGRGPRLRHRKARK